MLLTYGTNFCIGKRTFIVGAYYRDDWLRFNLGNYLASLCNICSYVYKLRAAFSCILTHIALLSSAANTDCCELQKIHVGNPNRLLEPDVHLRELIYLCFASLFPLFSRSSSHLLCRDRLFLHTRRCTRACVLVEIYDAPVHSPHLWARKRSSSIFSLLLDLVPFPSRWSLHLGSVRRKYYITDIGIILEWFICISYIIYNW